MGVVNPERITDGMMKTKEPSRACCMVMDNDDTSRPILERLDYPPPASESEVKEQAERIYRFVLAGIGIWA